MKKAVRVEVEGFDELVRKLTDHKLAREPLKEMLAEGARLGQVAAVKGIEGGTGMAMASIGQKVYSRGMGARVYTRIAKPQAQSIEQGRPPGQVVPLPSLAMWLLGSPRRIFRLSRAQERVVLDVQEKIRLRGTAGKGYMLAARTEVDREMPKLKARALAKIRELFRR